MSDSPASSIAAICAGYGNDRSRMIAIVRAVQASQGGVSSEAMNAIAEQTGARRVEVESVVSFYHFLSEESRGRTVIWLCDDIIDRLKGYEEVRAAFSAELGIALGETTSDGLFTLERTACIGMCDQAPAALINDTVVTGLTPAKVRDIVAGLREHGDPQQLVTTPGDGNNAHELVRAMVRNNVREAGPVVLSPLNRGEAIRKALGMTPAEVIRSIKTSRLRGRGGAGFPTGMKWEFTRKAAGDTKYVICNADEGEPGTFKDRVLLTELPDRVFAGMTIAGYAIGAREGILYLRSEYAYLRAFLESVLEERRADRLLGENIRGSRFDFDITIQMGAGAYICGEETALISSCEGLRGDPKNRPPFPAQKGYRGCPTTINNVETLCCVTKIAEEGAATFSHIGTKQSAGTKLLSVSGDCAKGGVYEVEFGITINELLEKVSAANTIAVQVGGPSGRMIAPEDFERRICFDDLATGGSIMIFGKGRDLLEVVSAFTGFFCGESCGYCTPCRVGTTLLRTWLDRLRAGRGEPGDLASMQRIGAVMKATSRCGLGQTAANPVLSTLENFRSLYDDLVAEDPDGFRRSFDLKEAVAESEALTGRASIHVPEPGEGS